MALVTTTATAQSLPQQGCYRTDAITLHPNVSALFLSFTNAEGRYQAYGDVDGTLLLMEQGRCSAQECVEEAGQDRFLLEAVTPTQIEIMAWPVTNSFGDQLFHLSRGAITGLGQEFTLAFLGPEPCS